MPSRTALYMRMSTDKQENSIESQKSVLNAYAKRNKLKVTACYTDEGISGRLANKRPAFMQMIEDSEKCMFDIVLVYDSSRFARNLEESIVYKSALKRNGVRLISITEPSLDDDTSLISDAMLGALNEMYSRKLSKSVKRGMVFNAQKGLYQTPPPFGYTKKNGIVSVVKDEEIVIKKMFEMFILCPSYHSIAVKLNEMGHTKRSSKPWRSVDIKRLLQNKAYIGQVFYAGEYYTGEHDKIVSDELFRNVQALISSKPKCVQRPPISYSHWLSGILKCSHCNSTMNYAKDWNGNASYRCKGNAVGTCKYANFLSVSKLEKLVLSALNELLINTSLMDYNLISAGQSDDEISRLKKTLQKLESRLKRCKTAYSCGVDTLDEYRQNKTSIINDKNAILNRIQAIESELNKTCGNNETETLSVNELLSSNKYTIEQKSHAIKSIIDRIVIDKYTGELTVYYYL